MSKEISVKLEQTPAVIRFNYEDAKKQLSAILEEYQGAVFTDDSIKTAKVIVAELRKQKKALNDRRIAFEKEYMKPYKEKESQVKDVISLFDTPINFIADQISGYEERKKEEKKAEISTTYYEVIGNMVEYLPLEKIYNPKWENATFKLNDVKKEMQEVISSTEQSINTIKAMKSEAVEKALLRFKIDLSLANAITYINNYEAQKAEILRKENERKEQEEKRRQDEEIAKAKREAVAEVLKEQQREVEVEARVREVAEQAKAEVIEQLTPDIEEELQTFFYKIQVGEKGKQTLEMYLDSVGIDWSVM